MNELKKRINMKDYRFKAVAYSLFLTVLLTTLCWAFERNDSRFFSIIILNVLSFVAFMIMLWDNKPMIRYFWRGSADWLKPADHLLCGILGIITYISARYVYYTYNEEQTFNIMACILCLCAAISFRKVYLNHAPDDIEKYEIDRKINEEVNTYVTVAECKDVESARIIKNMLESNGIEATTYGESSPEYLGYVPVRVLVKRKDKEAAEKLINE